MTALELHEQRRLDVCEERIRRGLATFVDVGKALTEIRDARLYRETHGTFDEYCRERWGFTDRRARQMIEAAEIGRILPVENAGQANELARVPEDDRADVWAEVNERTDGKPTAATIRDVRRERLEPVPRGCSTCGGTEDHLRDCALIPQTPRAQDELPDPHAVGPVEDLGAPAPSVTPTDELPPLDPEVQAELEREAARESELRAARNNLRSVLTYLTSRSIPPGVLAKQDYGDVIHEFDPADLSYAARTLEHLVEMRQTS